MNWLDAIQWAVQISLVVFLFSYLGRPFLPEWYNEAAATVGMRFLLLVSQIPGVIYNTSLALSTLAYYIGLLFVVNLLGAGVFLFTYAVATQLGFSHPVLESWYELLASVSKKREAWAGSTVAVATTVAIGHAWNLRLNRIKFEKEVRKLDQEEKVHRRTLQSPRPPDS